MTLCTLCGHEGYGLYCPSCGERRLDPVSEVTKEQSQSRSATPSPTSKQSHRTISAVERQYPECVTDQDDTSLPPLEPNGDDLFANRLTRLSANRLTLIIGPDADEELRSAELRLRESTLLSFLTRLEEDPRRRDIYDAPTETSLSGWCRPSVLPLEITVTGPVFDENLNSVYHVSAYVHVGQLPDVDLARFYVNGHNLNASTTYAWIYSSTNNIMCVTSSVIREDSEDDITAAIAIMREMYSAALGKWTWFATGDAPDGWVIPKDELPHDWTDEDAQKVPANIHECVRLLEYGNKYGNDWASTILPTTSQEITSALLYPIYGTRLTRPPMQPHVSIVPFWETVGIAGAVEQHGISVAAKLALVLDTHPYIGQGMRATLHMPHRIRRSDAVEMCNALNTGEVLQILSGSTTRGAWLVDPLSAQDPETVDIAFNSFYASAYCGLIDVEEVVADMFRRAQFVSHYLGHTHLDGSTITMFNPETGPGSIKR